MSDNTKQLFDFTEHLKVLNRSTATINAYTGHIKTFLNQLTSDSFKSINSSDMETYIASLYAYTKEDGTQYSISTICLKIRSLKRFFEFLEQSNSIFINPMESIREPRQHKTIPPDILTKAEITKLLDQPNLGTKTGIRNRTVLELFYSTGIRLQELCSLTIYDIDLQGKMVRINQGKGRKDRVIPMGKHVIRFLREYISKIRPSFTQKNRKSRILFMNHHGKPLSKQVVYLMIRKYVTKSKKKKKITAHSLRHTFASALVKNGADVVAVQKMLGHANLKTTQGYIRRLGTDLKKIHAKSHPRERDKVNRKSIRPDIKRMSAKRK